MDTEDGQVFIKHLAHFVRTHEKALANALQSRRQKASHPQSPSAATPSTGRGLSGNNGTLSSNQTHAASSTTAGLAAALSIPYLNFASQSIKPAKLSLTPHHLFYLLSRFDELNIPVGPMNVRLESIHTDSSPGNYVSFLSQSARSKGRGSDRDSIHSISSVRSVMSGMSSLWSTIGLGPSNSAAKSEKAKAALETDLKYLYSAFTKIPCLRLAPDRKTRLIQGYEEFPFDTAVPLIAFKNVTALELCDVDIRQIFGWDRLADQLRSLTVRRANVEDPTDLLTNIVLDDMDKRRRRSTKAQPSPELPNGLPSPIVPRVEISRSYSAPGSPKSADKLSESTSPKSVAMVRGGSDGSEPQVRSKPRSRSPSMPTTTRTASSHGHVRSGGVRIKRSSSTSSQSSTRSAAVRRCGSSSNVLSIAALPSTKWMFLRHLSLADNSLTALTASSLSPLADTLHSLDLSSNLFAQIPDCLASLTSLRALNLSNCMIDSLHSLSRNPLPAITALNLRGNRLSSIAGVQRLFSLDRLDLRDNRLTDPTELARLTGIPDIREVWVTGNPFTKTHSGYRVTIFNLFRTTPGYTDDVLIDSSSPGYSERRQLADRVADLPNVPVVKPPPLEYKSMVPLPLAANQSQKLSLDSKGGTDQLSAAAEQPQSLPYVGSARRKKGAKRRVVEFSRPEAPLLIDTHAPPNSPRKIEVHQVEKAGEGEAPATTVPFDPPLRQRSDQTLTQPYPRLDTSMGPPPRPTSNSANNAPKDSQDWNISSEIYKQKIEALRHEVGNGWLSVLSEEGWDGRNAPLSNPGDFSPASTIRASPTTPRAGAPAIMSGSRTLG